jgi:CubicO group peptidase (beta-lactamase class C family)
MSENVAEKNNRNDLKAFIKRVKQASGVPGISVALNVKGETLRVAGGYADVETQAPMTPNSRFELGCVKKLLTAMVVLELTRERQIELSAPISSYLPELVGQNGDRILVRHLLSFTSGYQDVNILDPDVSEDYTYDDFASSVNDRIMLFRPGTVFSYSHTASVLLGKIIESVTREDAWSAICRRVLDKLGVSTSEPDTHPEKAYASAHLLSVPWKSDVAIDAVTLSKPTRVSWGDLWKVSLGGPSITISDLVKIGAAIVEGSSVLSSQSREWLLSSTVVLPGVFRGQDSEEPFSSFGLGCGQYPTGIHGFKSSSTSGQSIAVYFDIIRGIVIGVGVNADSNHIRDYVGKKLYNSMLPEDAQTSEKPIPPYDIADLTGIYEGAQFHTIQANTEEGQLRLRFGHNPAYSHDTVKAFFSVTQDDEGHLVPAAPLIDLSVGFFPDPDSSLPCLLVGGMSYKKRL